MLINKFVSSKPNAVLITQLPEQGMEKEDCIKEFKHYYVHLLGADENSGTSLYASEALSIAIRNRLMERWKATGLRTYRNKDCRQLFYLSMEFLMGRTAQ